MMENNFDSLCSNRKQSSHINIQSIEIPKNRTKVPVMKLGNQFKPDAIYNRS